jgi:hypothetical protein
MIITPKIVSLQYGQENDMIRATPETLLDEEPKKID